MTWTKEQPTVPGLYWIRDATNRPALVHVLITDGKPGYKAGITQDGDLLLLTMPAGFEWHKAEAPE